MKVLLYIAAAFFGVGGLFAFVIAVYNVLRDNYERNKYYHWHIEKNENGVVTKYVYDGNDLICEYDGRGALQAKYVYGRGIDDVVSMKKGGVRYYYRKDALGSVIGLTDDSGKVVETYTYDAFGRPDRSSSVGNRFMFTGREYDGATGLYFYRARYYSPVLGRFLQPDPCGYIDGENLYRYCRNNSLNLVDPLGLFDIDPELLGEMISVGAGKTNAGKIVTTTGDVLFNTGSTSDLVGGMVAAGAGELIGGMAGRSLGSYAGGFVGGLVGGVPGAIAGVYIGGAIGDYAGSVGVGYLFNKKYNDFVGGDANTTSEQNQGWDGNSANRVCK